MQCACCKCYANKKLHHTDKHRLQERNDLANGRNPFAAQHTLEALIRVACGARSYKILLWSLLAQLKTKASAVTSKIITARSSAEAAATRGGLIDAPGLILQ
jgi:hypothetical protein